MKKLNQISMNVLLIFVVILVLVSMTGCSFITEAADQDFLDSEKSAEKLDLSDTDDAGEDVAEEIDRPEGWTAESHGNDAEPNYEVVFLQDAVNRLDITITSENWEAMLVDMTELMGEFGSGSDRMDGNQPNFPGTEAAEGERPERPGAGELPEGEMPQPPEDIPQPSEDMPEMPNDGETPEGGRPQPGGDFGGRSDGGFGMDFMDENPVWVTATIEFEGQTWENVGIRFKGNSSLRSAWSSGNLKIPFKLDFDQFEEDYPEINDQRFYGFKQLSLANNFSDASYLREKVTADIFREFGVPSAHTAFYEVYVDTGDGPAYFGLYTMVEMVEDTVIEEQFVDDSGNLYKPDGTGATFAAGSFNESSFDKETNQEEADYSDIQALFEALHAESRLSDPATWREGLESVFDVNTFLRWLAVNMVVQNWDTYGAMSHNYYLYSDPETGLITWIPWDNNMALTDAVGKRSVLSLSLDAVNEQWPLIRFVMDDPVYKELYESYLDEVVEIVFEPEAMAETYTFYHMLVADSVLKEREEATTLQSPSAFKTSLQELIDHVNQRYQAVQAYLSE